MQCWTDWGLRGNCSKAASGQRWEPIFGLLLPGQIEWRLNCCGFEWALQAAAVAAAEFDLQLLLRSQGPCGHQCSVWHAYMHIGCVCDVV